MTLDLSTLCFWRRGALPLPSLQSFDVVTDWLKVRAVTEMACRTLAAPRHSEGSVWFTNILRNARKAEKLSRRGSRVAGTITCWMKWCDCDAPVESAWLGFGFQEFNAAYLQHVIYIAATLFSNWTPDFWQMRLNGSCWCLPNISFTNKWNALNKKVHFISKNCSSVKLGLILRRQYQPTYIAYTADSHLNTVWEQMGPEIGLQMLL